MPKQIICGNKITIEVDQNEPGEVALHTLKLYKNKDMSKLSDDDKIKIFNAMTTAKLI